MEIEWIATNSMRFQGNCLETSLFLAVIISDIATILVYLLFVSLMELGGIDIKSKNIFLQILISLTLILLRLMYLITGHIASALNGLEREGRGFFLLFKSKDLQDNTLNYAIGVFSY